MLLHDMAIREALDTGELTMHPYPLVIQPGSIDLTLGRYLEVESDEGDAYKHDLVNDGDFLIRKGDFILGATFENFRVRGALAGEIVGKSTRAREGLMIEAAGYFDNGWQGEGTLEISLRRGRPLFLSYKMPIAQIRFHVMTGEPVRPYGHPDLNSHYQNSVGPVKAYTERD